MDREEQETLVLSGGVAGDTTIEIPKADIVERRLSDVSPMPAGLLNGLAREQILDLLAFLASGQTKLAAESSQRAGE
jgi:hypothetical protein